MTWCRAWQEEGGLPRSCHVVLPGLPAGGNVAVCVRGAHGVRMTNIDLGDWQTARRLVRAINGSLVRHRRGGGARDAGRVPQKLGQRVG